MKRLNFCEKSIESTLEERAMAGLYAFCSHERAKEKKRMSGKRQRPQNRDMRWPGH